MFTLGARALAQNSVVFRHWVLQVPFTAQEPALCLYSGASTWKKGVHLVTSKNCACVGNKCE